MFIRFSINMADPDLVEPAKEVLAIIEQSRKELLEDFEESIRSITTLASNSTRS